MKIIFLLSVSLIYCTVLAAAENLKNSTQSSCFQKDTVPKTNQSEFVAFHCRAIETEACIDSAKWHSYISRQLTHLTDSIGSSIRPGTYKVKVIFLIERNGRITDTKSLNDTGFNLTKLAEQIIRNGPVWEPSTRNGKFTRSYKKEEIIFEIPTELNCDSLKDDTLIL